MLLPFFGGLAIPRIIKGFSPESASLSLSSLPGRLFSSDRICKSLRSSEGSDSSSDPISTRTNHRVGLVGSSGTADMGLGTLRSGESGMVLDGDTSTSGVRLPLLSKEDARDRLDGVDDALSETVPSAR